MTDCCIPQQNPALYPLHTELSTGERENMTKAPWIASYIEGEWLKRKIKIRERCANVFVTMPRYDTDARLGALGEFLGKNSPNALCNVQILGI
jgi:hypothetical protein